MKSCIIYLGNGFDLASGFKTGYSHFISSDIFEELTKSCYLARWIKYKFEEDRDKWSDLEELLYRYSLQLCFKEKDYDRFISATELFKEEHKNLSTTLHEYIVKQTSGDATIINKVIASWKEYLDIIKICCFNYTSTPVFGKLIDTYYKLSGVHGKADLSGDDPDAPIKLGIDRCMKVCPEHEFLYKDTMPGNAVGIWVKPDTRLRRAGEICNSTIHPEFEDVDVIVLYGCSLGRSDTAYYSFLFTNVRRKKIVLYHYGESERSFFEKRIRDLSNGAIKSSDVVFIDSSKNGGYLKDFGEIVKR